MNQKRDVAPVRILAARWSIVAISAALSMTTVAQDRAVDGAGNNVAQPSWGSVDIHLVRAAPNAYADGVEALAGPNRENPRVISNAVIHQDTSGGVIIPDPRGLTDYIWVWGQFVDHDIDLTPGDGPGTAFIPIPVGDPWYDPNSEGGKLLPFRRSRIDFATGTDPANPREQINNITAFLDGSNVYGSDTVRADWLRTGVGGLMKMNNDPVVGNMPPFNDGSQSNAGGNDPLLFVAGDVRANVTSPLTSMHTLFLREHNRLASELALANPSWTDEQLYQQARKIIGGLIEHITFSEFLPALLGTNAMPAYTGYNPAVNSSIRSEFSTAAYRFGHSQLSPILLRLDALGDTIPQGNLSMRDSYFEPNRLMLEGGIDPILRGLAAGQSQKVDSKLNDDVRIFLFGDIGDTPPAMDLAALNIQRARDHGLADYNTIRAAYGLAPALDYSDISSDPTVASALASVYPDINDIDPWVGMICEDLYAGSSVGETVYTILVDQFTRLRDGDRFWYENDPALADDLAWIQSQRLSDVIVRDTSISGDEIQPNLFFISCPGDLTGNLIVDGADLASMLVAWNSADPVADLNGDGVVNGADLAQLLTSWGSCL